MTKTTMYKRKAAPIYASNILLAALVKTVFLCSSRGFLWRRLAGYPLLSGWGFKNPLVCYIPISRFRPQPSLFCQMPEGITWSSLAETFVSCKTWAGFNSFSWFQEYETKEYILSWFKCWPLPEGLLIWWTYLLQGIWFCIGSAILPDLCW